MKSSFLQVDFRTSAMCTFGRVVPNVKELIRRDRVKTPDQQSCRHLSGPIFALCLTVGVLLPSAGGAGGAEIWLCGVDPYTRSIMFPGAPSDYLELFEPIAPWSNAAGNVQVFKISTQLVQYQTDQILGHVFADLKQRHISLALEAGLLTSNDTCGRRVEGYAPPGKISRAVERIHRLGGNLRYVAMDEPLWFGRRFSGVNACHADVAALAREVSRNVSVIRRYFPAVQIGDIEPVGSQNPADWPDQISQWITAYQAAVGEPPAFFHADVSWPGPWRQQLTQLAPRLHAAGIKFGIIYNGSPDDQTDLIWTTHAEEHFSAVETNPELTPDQAVLQTWMPHPSRMLPETEAGPMTWLVNRYIAPQSRLFLHRKNGRLEGQLTDTTGRPLVGASVTVSAELSGEPGVPVLHMKSGGVPPKAVTAVLALRINTECGCSSPADVDIGLMRYHDERAGQIVQQAFRSPSLPPDSDGLHRFQAQPGQAITLNTLRFPVVAGDSFTIQVPMRISLASTDSGYVALVFLDEHSKEVERLRLPFEPVERPIGSLTTDAQGRFSLLPDPHTLRASIGFQAEFPGNSGHRSALGALR